MKWTVTRDKTVDKSFIADCKSGAISIEDRTAIAAWLDQVERYGPDSLRQIRRISELENTDFLENNESLVNFWNDHDLDGDRAGQRSSSFSRLGRIIYKIEDNKIRIIKILKITPKHEY